MKKTIELIFTLAIVAALSLSLQAQENSIYGEFHVHNSDSLNTNSNVTDLQPTNLQSFNNQIIFITPNWTPVGGDNVYNIQNPGIWFNTATTDWSIFNQSQDSIPYGAAWNVLFADNLNALMYTHTADSMTNIIDNWTQLSHPKLNGDSTHIIFITQSWNPDGANSGTYNDHAVGVWYDDDSIGIWNVFNQDLADMPHDASFNIFVPDPSPNVWVHTTDSTNSFGGNSTYLDHDSLNGNPDAVIFVTQNWNPENKSGVYNDKAIAVWYDQLLGQWAIFNQDQSSMPMGASFNVMFAAKGNPPTSVSEVDNLDINALFPNPTDRNVTTTFSLQESAVVSINVYDMSGKQQLDINKGLMNRGTYNEQISLGQLPGGYYILTINAGDNVVRRPLVIAR